MLEVPIRIAENDHTTRFLQNVLKCQVLFKAIAVTVIENFKKVYLKLPTSVTDSS